MNRHPFGFYFFGEHQGTSWTVVYERGLKLVIARAEDFTQRGEPDNCTNRAIDVSCVYSSSVASFATSSAIAYGRVNYLQKELFCLSTAILAVSSGQNNVVHA